MTATTTDGTALLAAIRAAPEDDGLRLVYADWLDENATYLCGECNNGIRSAPGQIKCFGCDGTGRILNTNAERAEFIRVQCELAQPEPKCEAPAYTGKGVLSCAEWNGWHPDRNDWCKPCAARHALRRRERELLEEPRHFVNWVPLFLHRGSGVGVRYKEDTTVEITGGEVKSVTFSRGFLSHVAAPLDVLIGGSQCTGCSGGVTGFYGEYPCEDCHGTGRTPGILGPLLEREPVTSVRATDREPHKSISDQWQWYDAARTDGSIHPQSDLPTAIFKLLPGEEFNGGRFKDFPTPDAAHAALSDALIAVSKRRD